MTLRAALFAGALALTPAGGHAQTDPSATAQAAMEALTRAAASLEAAERADDRVEALTETVHAYETGLAALREGLRQAAIRETAIRGMFDAESERLGQLLGVLQAISAAPAPHLLLHPSGPLGTAEAGMILSDITPALAKEAAELRAALDEIAVLRSLQEAAVTTLEDGLSGAQEARTNLSQALSNRIDLPQRFVTDEDAMETLLSSADTLESFAGGLMSTTTRESAAATAYAAAQADFETARDLPLPVQGRVIRGYNAADAAGIERPGWVIATRPLTLVTTPWPVTIRYLGPLLDYGNVAILEPGEGWLIVLAGLAELYGEAGQVISAGTPIGLMGGVTADQSQAFLMASQDRGGAEASETLYMELRQDGTPVDPATRFTDNNR